MRHLTIKHLPLALLLGLACSSSATLPSGGPGDSHQLTEKTWLSAYDQKVEYFRVLYDELWGRWGEDPQLIEAGELASVAEEFYLVAEYETAMEVLRQAIQLLEERQRGEKTPP